MGRGLVPAARALERDKHTATLLQNGQVLVVEEERVAAIVSRVGREV